MRNHGEQLVHEGTATRRRNKMKTAQRFAANRRVTARTGAVICQLLELRKSASSCSRRETSSWSAGLVASSLASSCSLSNNNAPVCFSVPSQRLDLLLGGGGVFSEFVQLLEEDDPFGENALSLFGHQSAECLEVKQLVGGCACDERR